MFYTKSLGKASAPGKGGKTVKKECTIRLAAASEQFITASIVNETNLSFVHGSVFGIKRS